MNVWDFMLNVLFPWSRHPQAGITGTPQAGITGTPQAGFGAAPRRVNFIMPTMTAPKRIITLKATHYCIVGNSDIAQNINKMDKVFRDAIGTKSNGKTIGRGCKGQDIRDLWHEIKRRSCTDLNGAMPEDPLEDINISTMPLYAYATTQRKVPCFEPSQNGRRVKVGDEIKPGERLFWDFLSRWYSIDFTSDYIYPSSASDVGKQLWNMIKDMVETHRITEACRAYLKAHFSSAKCMPFTMLNGVAQNGDCAYCLELNPAEMEPGLSLFMWNFLSYQAYANEIGQGGTAAFVRDMAGVCDWISNLI